MNQATNNKGSVLGAALTGLVAGVVAGILLAPKSGKETRQDLAVLANRMRDDIADRLQKLSKVTATAYNEIVDNVVHQYQQAKEITSEQAKELKDEFAKSYEKVKQVAEEETNASQRISEDVKKLPPDNGTPQ